MTIIDLAKLAVEACEAEGVEMMMTGAFATGIDEIPRSTKDVDLVISADPVSEIYRVIDRLSGVVKFGEQVQFDTLTRGRRHIGKTVDSPFHTLELFELFDDPFVMSQFERRELVMLPALGREVMVSKAEDVIVQKLRWARDKDLLDARDVVAVQGTEDLDMAYIKKWCREHGSMERLENILKEVDE